MKLLLYTLLSIGLLSSLVNSGPTTRGYKDDNAHVDSAADEDHLLTDAVGNTGLNMYHWIGIGAGCLGLLVLVIIIIVVMTGSGYDPDRDERDDTPPVVVKLTFLSQLFNILNFAKKKRVKVTKPPNRDALSAKERFVMRDHEIRFRTLLAASQTSLWVGNPVGVDSDEWYDEDVEFDLFDLCIEEANGGIATGLAVVLNGIFSHRPIRPDRRYAAYYGVRRNGEKWNPRFFGFD